MKQTVKKANPKLRQNSLNLYKFIRLILGTKIPDRQIAKKWKMDEKNFHEFKTGKYPVPRLSKLEALEPVLKVNKHLIFQVASGTSAQKVFNLIKRNDPKGQIRLLSNQLNKIYSALAKSEERYRDLFNNVNDAIFIAEPRTKILIDCNKQAEELLGRPRAEIVGMHVFQLHPFEKQMFYKRYFEGHVRRGRINDPRKAEVVKKDGTIVPVLVSARVFNLDGQKVIQGIFRDISSAVFNKII